MDNQKDFTKRVYDEVTKIPKGRLSTYQRIAALCGSPKASRAVGNILHHNPYKGIVPCHRVVNSEGKLSDSFGFGGVDVQRHLLEEEGVEVINNIVDLDKYGCFNYQIIEE